MLNFVAYVIPIPGGHHIKLLVKFPSAGVLTEQGKQGGGIINIVHDVIEEVGTLTEQENVNTR